jgi:hypothetical protein
MSKVHERNKRQDARSTDNTTDGFDQQRAIIFCRCLVPGGSSIGRGDGEEIADYRIGSVEIHFNLAIVIPNKRINRIVHRPRVASDVVHRTSNKYSDRRSRVRVMLVVHGYGNGADIGGSAIPLVCEKNHHRFYRDQEGTVNRYHIVCTGRNNVSP